MSLVSRVAGFIGGGYVDGGFTNESDIPARITDGGCLGCGYAMGMAEATGYCSCRVCGSFWTAGDAMTRKYRDARTGEYVSPEYAKANPDTTVSEDDSRVAEMERRVMQLEATVEWLLKGLGAPRPTL